MGQGKERTAHLLRHRKEKGQFSDRLRVAREYRESVTQGGLSCQLRHQFVCGIAFCAQQCLHLRRCVVDAPRIFPRDEPTACPHHQYGEHQTGDRNRPPIGSGHDLRHAV